MLLTLPAAKAHHRGWIPGTHRGLDYGWGSGDQVLAAAPGKVISVYSGGGKNGGWGNRVIIDHGGKNYTTYNHLANGSILVREGQQVARGQKLGTMGTTGTVTGKHLHFELERGGRGSNYRVDPVPYFTQHLPGTETPPMKENQRQVGKTPLKVRSGPTSQGGDTGVLLPVGGVYDILGWKFGEEVRGEGNAVWYRVAAGWTWSGGYTTATTIGLKDENPAPPTVPEPQPVPVDLAEKMIEQLEAISKTTDAGLATGLRTEEYLKLPLIRVED